MTNLELLIEGGVLKANTQLTPSETEIVDALDPEDIELAIETHEPPMTIFNMLFPNAGLGRHNIAGTPNGEQGS